MPKFIFTNCTEKQAREALECLGLSHCSEYFYGSDFMGEHCKPERLAFEKVLRDIRRRLKKRKSDDDDDDDENLMNDDNPSANNDHDDNADDETKLFQDDEVFFFEDSIKNLVSAAKEFNISGVLVRGQTTTYELEEVKYLEKEKNEETTTTNNKS